MSARENILSRIRSAVALSPELRYDSVPRQYRRSAPADIDLFIDRLHDYGSTVFECSIGEVPATVLMALVQAGKSRIAVAAGFPPEWRPEGAIVETDLSEHDLERMEGAVTTCEVAVAETGTIVLRHSAQEGRRALTLLPDYHLCVVEAQRVVSTVPEGITRMTGLATEPVTMISGSSATSDIEMTRVKGVHGPRVLDVIIVHE